HGQRRVRRVEVVLADEHDRKPPDRRPVEAFVKDTLVDRAVAEEGDGDAALPVHLEGERGPHRDRDSLGEDRRRCDHSDLGVGEMDRSAASPRAARFPAVELGDQGGEIAALGEVVRVTAMATVDDIVALERAAHADGDGLLAHGEMRRGAHFLLLVELGEPLFDPAHAEHLAVQPKKGLPGDISWQATRRTPGPGASPRSTRFAVWHFSGQYHRGLDGANSHEFAGFRAASPMLPSGSESGTRPSPTDETSASTGRRIPPGSGARCARKPSEYTFRVDTDAMGSKPRCRKRSARVRFVKK